jgi:hypothetical protein
MTSMRILLPVSLLLALAGFLAGRSFGHREQVQMQRLENPPVASVELEAPATRHSPQNLADIESALRDASSDRDWTLRRLRIYRAVRDATDEQFAGILGKHGASDSFLNGEILAFWWEQSPDAARAWFEAQPVQSRQHFVPAAVDAAANRDALAALRWLASLPDKSAILQNLFTRNDAVQKLAAAAPRETWKLLTSAAPDLATVGPFASIVFREWARTEPLAAAAEAEKLEMVPETKNTIVAAIAGSWSAQDHEAARRWVESLGEWKLKSAALLAIGVEWAKRDPQAALTFLAETSSDYSFNTAYTRLISDWTIKEPEAAMNYAAQLTGNSAASAKNAILKTFAATDPVRAVEYWRSHAMDVNHGDELAVALAARSGLPAAAQFFQGLPDAAGSKSYLFAEDKLVQMFGWEKLADALGPLPQSPIRDEAVSRISTALAYRGDMPRAETLAATLPEGTARATALTGIASTIRREKSADDAAQWLLERGGSSAALERFARRWMFEDRETALAWIQSTQRLPESSRSILLKPQPPTNQ